MERRKNVSRVAFAAAACTLLVITGCASGSESSPAGTAVAECPAVSYGVLDDDSQRAAYYAIEQGIVTSELIPSVEPNYLQIPALIQAAGSGQFDYVMVSLSGLVDAREQGGIDLRAVGWAIAHTGGGLSLYAKEGSGITKPEDLKGKTVATTSFGSSGLQAAQMVLEEAYGLDASLEGGDITWVELDPPTMLNAIEQGTVDAGVTLHLGAWLAASDPKLAKIAQLDQDFNEMTDGQWPIGAAIVGYGDAIDEAPKCTAEFQRMLEESVAYAVEHHAEFASEIAEQTGVPVDYIDYWWNPAHYQFGAVADDAWNGYAQEFYDLAVEQGLIAKSVDIDEFTVSSPR